MKTSLFLWILLAGALPTLQAQDTLRFASLDSLLDYAATHRYSRALGDEQQHYAKMQRWASIGNTVNPRLPVTFSMIDNTELPVNFIPAEIFGGPAGTFRQMTLGQEYVSTFTFTPQLDLVNPGAIAKVKSAKLSEELTAMSNELTEKNVLDAVQMGYFNLLSLRSQQAVLRQNLAIADSLAALVENRYAQGLVRPQDRNETKINQLQLRDKIEQLDYLIQHQLLALQILCDIPESTPIAVETPLPASDTDEVAPAAQSQLQSRYQQLQLQYSKAERTASYWSNAPVLSFVSSFSWQNNSNDRFFDPDRTWISSNYWGFRLTYNFPTDVQRLTQLQATYTNHRIANIQLEHTQLQSDLQNKQLENDCEKTFQQWSNYQQIVDYKQDTYLKNRNQYLEQLLPLDKLLLAQNELTTAQLNAAVAEINWLYAKAKIALANRY